MNGRRPPPDPAKPRSIDRRELNAIEAAREKTKPAPPRPTPAEPPFAELVAATNFSFLRGASHASDMVERAMALGLTGIGIADRNSVAGVVRAHVALNIDAQPAAAQVELGPTARETARELLYELSNAVRELLHELGIAHGRSAQRGVPALAAAGRATAWLLEAEHHSRTVDVLAYVRERGTGFGVGLALALLEVDGFGSAAE